MAESFDELVDKTANEKTRGIAARRTKQFMDAEFLNWLADRIVYVYGESPNVDFVHKLRTIAANLERNYT